MRLLFVLFALPHLNHSQPVYSYSIKVHYLEKVTSRYPNLCFIAQDVFSKFEDFEYENTYCRTEPDVYDANNSKFIVRGTFKNVKNYRLEEVYGQLGNAVSSNSLYRVHVEQIYSGDEKMPRNDPEIGPLLAVFEFNNEISVTRELTTDEISAMQNELQHIDHQGGVMVLEMQPSRGPENVKFNFDSDQLSYTITWLFHDVEQNTTISLLEEIGQKVAISADTETSKFVDSMDEVIELKRFTEHTLEIEYDYDPDSCTGSRINYDITVDTFFPSATNFEGVIAQICQECLFPAPHVSIHDLIDNGCSNNKISDTNYHIFYSWTKNSNNEVIYDKDVDYYTTTLDTEARKCIEGKISEGILTDETSLETSHTIICGYMEEFSLPIQSIIAAVIGSLFGIFIFCITVHCMRKETQYTTLMESQTRGCAQLNEL